MKSNSEVTKINPHANNLSKGNQGRKSVELGKTLNGHEREKDIASKKMYLQYVKEILCFVCVVDVKYKVGA